MCRLPCIVTSGDTLGNTFSTTYSYITQNGQVVRQTGGGHTLDFVYDNQGRPMTLVYDGTAYTYMLNLQGDVIALLNSSGGYVAKYVYDAWGKVLSVGGTLSLAKWLATR